MFELLKKLNFLVRYWLWTAPVFFVFLLISVIKGSWYLQPFVFSFVSAWTTAIFVLFSIFFSSIIIFDFYLMITSMFSLNKENDSLHDIQRNDEINKLIFWLAVICLVYFFSLHIFFLFVHFFLKFYFSVKLIKAKEMIGPIYKEVKVVKAKN